MVGQVLTLSVLVALAQSKAIVTNYCAHDVYLWSVPDTLGVAKDLPIGPGKRYEEPWRKGTSDNPGIAIKVSPYANGISEGKSEIDFQYTVDQRDHNKIWVNLSNVRGNAFGDYITFFTCYGSYNTPDVPTRQCTVHDDVELVLCGSQRTEPPQDATSIKAIGDCTTVVERDGKKAPPRPRECNARVIGPKGAERQKKTVPLKSLLQAPAGYYTSNGSWVHGLEGCHNCTDVKAHAGRGKDEIGLCDRFWPGLPCDEDQVRQGVRLFYANACNIPSVGDCEHFRARLLQEFGSWVKIPVSKAASSKAVTRSDKERIVYIGQFCQKFIPNLDCKEVEDFMQKDNKDHYYFTDVDEFFHGSKKSAVNRTAKAWPFDWFLQYKVFIGDMCQRYVPDISCDTVEKFLENANPRFNFDTSSGDSSSDEEKMIPGKIDGKKLAGNKSTSKKPANKKSANKKSASKESVNVEPRHKPRVCINVLCKQNPNISCHKIEDMLEEIDPDTNYTTHHGCSD